MNLSLHAWGLVYEPFLCMPGDSFMNLSLHAWGLVYEPFSACLGTRL